MWRSVILVGALALIALTWGFTLISVATEEYDSRARVSRAVAGVARTIAWEFSRRFQTMDQALQMLAADWRADPTRFDAEVGNRRAKGPGEMARQVFVVDADGRVVASSVDDLRGLNVADRDYFIAQRDAGDGKLFVGIADRRDGGARWEIQLSRRLRRDDGGFAGAIVMTYDPSALTAMLEQVDLGPGGMIALLRDDGAVRALVAPPPTARDATTLVEPGSGLAMDFRAAARGDDVWVGPSATDGVPRVHAFRRLTADGITIVVGMDFAEAMHTALGWAANANGFAAGISVLVLIMAAILLRGVSVASGREERLAEDRAAIAHAFAALAAAKACADGTASQLRATLSGMSDGVMMLDVNLRVMQWNERFLEITGVRREDIRVGMDYADLLRGLGNQGEFGPVDIEAEVARRVAVVRGLRASRVFEQLRPNGRTLELRRDALPGGGFVTLYADITARKQIEAAQATARRLAEEVAEQKSRFAAMVSHEIRTPLNAVVNSLALLDHSGLPASAHRHADTARQASDALLDLVNDILELSRMESGHLSLRPTVFSLRAVLDGVRDMFRAQAERRGVTLVLDIAADMPERFRADCGRLRQILMNFVSNATKFSLPGEVTIRAVIGGAEREQRVLRLSVRDQGPRIPAREMGQLFQPFARLENARAQGVPGTGLGLAICARLARLMDGVIGAAPAPAGGNEFWIDLPLAAVIAPAPAAPAAPTAPGPRRRRAAVLLVDDSAANNLVTATLLRRDGHGVDIAASGAEAIARAAAHPYDVIFMDVMMPGLSGPETARRVRALAGPAARVPIVALSANTAPEDHARCRAAGMNDLLGKPLRPAELTAVLARMLSPVAVAAATDDWPRLPVIDPERLADLKRGLPAATLAALVTQCLAEMRERVPSLLQALAAGHGPAVEEAAHALAGMAGTYGLAALERRMRRVIAAARRGDLIDAAAVGADGIEADLDGAGAAMGDLLRERAA